MLLSERVLTRVPLRRARPRRWRRRHGHHCTRAVLRPLRLRHRCRSVPGVEAVPRRGAALFQREVRLLHAEPLRGRGAQLRRLGDVQLGQGVGDGDHQGEHRAAARHVHLRGPARPRPAPRSPQSRVHPPATGCDRAEGPGIRRTDAGSARREGGLRPHRRPGHGDPDAHHRHVVGHSRRGPASDAGPD